MNISRNYLTSITPGVVMRLKMKHAWKNIYTEEQQVRYLLFLGIDYFPLLSFFIFVDYVPQTDWLPQN